MILSNGVMVPRLGFGTYRIEPGLATEKAVTEALKVGYRLIDTAKLYANEESVGKAVRESAVAREEVFVTTKLWPTDFLQPESAFERSFNKLNLGYVDLYLVHFPIPYVPRKVWRTLEKLYQEKRVRAIGISNYGVKEMQELLSWCSIAPMVNQVKLHPFAYKRDVLEFCMAHNIALEAHTPLADGKKFDHPTIARIAAAHNRTSAQIMIRWALEKGAIVIPKSVNPDRIRSNFAVYDFQLTGADNAVLDALS